MAERTVIAYKVKPQLLADILDTLDQASGRAARDLANRIENLTGANEVEPLYGKSIADVVNETVNKKKAAKKAAKKKSTKKRKKVARRRGGK